MLVYADDLSVRFATYGWVYEESGAAGDDPSPRLRGRPDGIC